MTRLPRASVVLLTAASLLILTACGVSDGDASPRSPGSGSSSTSTTAPEGDTTKGPDDGTSYRDEDGRFILETGPNWEESSGTVANGITTWTVGAMSDGFTPNVNVLTQKTPDLTIDEYLDASRPGIESLLDDADILDQQVAKGSEGQEIGILEYAGEVNGVGLHFLAVATPVSDGVALTTFTATDEQFDELRDGVEPYLRTLRAA